MFNLAQAAVPASSGSALYSIGWLVIMAAIFYFLLIRPQSKRTKKRNEMLNALKIDDKVSTIGGIHGTIVEMTDEVITLRVNDNNNITFDRSAVNSVIEK
ncbi:MAG: preprotein translocase subunit YajC [Vulcanibacillus sp.]